MTKISRTRAARRVAAMNILRVASAVASTETVTLDGNVFEVYTGATAVTAGRISVDVSAGGAKAVGTLTASGVFQNNETVVIGSVTYTFKTALTGAANEVLIGASAAASLDNLKSAINASAGAGTTYGTGTTAHPTVTATTNTDTTQVVEAKVTGTDGNSIATTETCANVAWGGATLASGANPTAGEFTTAFTAALNDAAIGWTATRVSANEVLVVKSDNGYKAAACSETLAGSNNAWAAANAYGGQAPADDLPVSVLISRVPNATEVALGNMHFQFGFAPSAVMAFVRVTSTGVVKAWDGATAVSGNRVTLDNSGSTDWAATDTVLVLASK